MWYPNEKQLGAFDDRLIKDLAGNAFDASCFAATLFASLVLLSHGASGSSQHETASDSDRAASHSDWAASDTDWEHIWT